MAPVSTLLDSRPVLAGLVAADAGPDMPDQAAHRRLCDLILTMPPEVSDPRAVDLVRAFCWGELVSDRACPEVVRVLDRCDTVREASCA